MRKIVHLVLSNFYIFASRLQQSSTKLVNHKNKGSPHYWGAFTYFCELYQFSP